MSGQVLYVASLLNSQSFSHKKQFYHQSCKRLVTGLQDCPCTHIFATMLNLLVSRESSSGVKCRSECGEGGSAHRPADSGLHGLEDSCVGRQNSLIDERLLWSEAAISWECACDVRAICTLFTSGSSHALEVSLSATFSRIDRAIFGGSHK